MARNLLASGFDVVGYNRSRPKIDAFVSAGGRGADTVSEAATGADVVATMVGDSRDVEDVWRGTAGQSGVWSAAPPNCLLIDFSTISPASAAALAAEGAARGFRILDAPVSGGETGAIEGSLSIMVGGDDISFLAARPLLDAVGRTVVHVGAAGSGQTVKAANQLLVSGILELVAEAIVFLEAHDVAIDGAIEVLAGGLAGSAVLDRKAAAMLARAFEPGFRLALQHKDLTIFADAARDAGIVTPLGAVVAQLVASLVAQGHGGLDHSALVLGVERLSGRS